MIKNIKYILFFIVLLNLYSINFTYAQCCDTSLVTTFIVDLSSTPDSVWISPDVGRNGQCCGAIGEDCIQFIIYTNPNSTEAAFGVASPPDPPGQFYTIGCNDSTHMGQPACIQGGDTVCIIYCKGGTDQSEYAITVSNSIEASPDIAVSQGCTATIWATGFDGYVEWNSVYPGVNGTYNSYLDCQTCLLTGVTPPTSGYPPYVDYAITGDIYSPCTIFDATDTVRVFFVDSSYVIIQPDTPAVCFGAGVTTTITANAYGGAPPYTYLWSTGETTQSIDVGGGTYWVQVDDTTDCPLNYDTVIVYEFNMPINADAGPDQTPCSGTANVNLLGQVYIAQGGIWSGGSGSFSDNTDLNAVYTPTLLEISTGTFTLTLITTGNWGCPSDTDYVNITYLPDLTISAGNDILVCEDATSIPLHGIISNSVPIGLWTTTNGTGSFFPNDSNLTTSYLPTTADTANGFVTIVFQSDGDYDCNLKSDTMIITFGNDPIPTFTISQGCTGDLISFTNSTIGAVNWLWEFGNGNTSTLENPNDEVYNLPGNYGITLTVQDAMGCIGSLTSLTTIHPTPVPSIFFGTICETQYAQFTDISTVLNDTLISWLWDFDNGNTSNLQHPSTMFDLAGNYNVSLTVATNNCSATDTFTVKVDSLPIINILTNITQGCNMATVNFTNNTQNAVSYHWDFGDGVTSVSNSPTHTYSNTTTNDIVYNVEFVAVSYAGCEDTLTIPITIHPTPILDITFDDTPDCSPLDIMFTNNSTGASYYNWDFGDGTTSTDENPTHQFINTNSYIIYYNVVLVATSNFGCTDSINQFVTVFPNPDSDFSVNSNSFCSPTNIEFNTVSGQYSYEWFYGDGTSEMGGFTTWHSYYNNTNNDTAYVIQLVTTTSFGCSDTVENIAIIHPSPIANFDVDVLSGCTPLTLNINNNSTGGTIFHWNYGDGNLEINSSLNFAHTYINNGLLPLNYTLRLITESANGCKDSVSRTITVYPTPLASFISDDSIGCSPLNVTFTNGTIGSVQYYWDFGDGNYSTNTHPTNTFVNSGIVDSIYTVQLMATSVYNCVDTTFFPIIVHPEPEALFGLNNSSGCAPYTLEITNNSSGAINFYWDFGDGNTSVSTNSTLSNIYENILGIPQSYIVELIAENTYGCTDTVIQTISVLPEVIVNFISDTSGCTPLTVNYNNQSIGGFIYEWSFGDGSSSNDYNPSHTFHNLNSFLVDTLTTTLTVTSYYNCEETFSQNIYVYPAADAIISVNEITGCSPFEAIIINNTTGGTTFNWNFGDGTDTTILNSNDINHTFYNYSGSTSTYNIILDAENNYGCSDTASQLVTVYPNIEANFSPEIAGCSPLDVYFVNLSQGEESQYWTFGDGATSGEENPHHTFTNYGTIDSVYSVNLYVESQFNCNSTITKQITVYATPHLDFTVTPTYQVYPNTTVTIDNLTVGNWSYNWTMGDGVESTLAQPGIHSYNTWGEYTITSIAEAQNCTDELSHTIIIDAPQTIASFEPNASGCAPLYVEFVNNSLYGDSYLWKFGDGSQSSSFEPDHIYYEPGTYIVTLKVSNQASEALADERTITVYPDPIAYFKVVPSLVVIPFESCTFYNLSEYGSVYYWDFGDGSNSTEEQPSHIYKNEGSYDVSLYVESEHGCKDTILIKNAVIAEASCEIVFPNAFTPAGANRSENRLFKPIYKGISDYELQIFNQWGELIFVSNDIDVGWDGMYKGELSKLDVYVWKATWVCINGEKFTRVGDVTLIR